MLGAQKAYGLLTVKGVSDGDQRVITGVASTPKPDRVKDVMEPKGARFAKSIPFLWQHQHDKPIGEAQLNVSGDKILFSASVARTDEAGELKNLLDRAWQNIKTRLVKGVSIGFMPIEYDYLDGGGILYKEYEIFELSAVTIPANSSATIETVKSLFFESEKDGGNGAIKLIGANDAHSIKQEVSRRGFVSLLSKK